MDRREAIFLLLLAPFMCTYAAHSASGGLMGFLKQPDTVLWTTAVVTYNTRPYYAGTRHVVMTSPYYWDIL